MAMDADPAKCELRFANGQWSLLLPLASIEDAAETLFRLGRSGSTEVSVKIYNT